jgi:hypothetical protein
VGALGQRPLTPPSAPLSRTGGRGERCEGGLADPRLGRCGKITFWQGVVGATLVVALGRPQGPPLQRDFFTPSRAVGCVLSPAPRADLSNKIVTQDTGDVLLGFLVRERAKQAARAGALDPGHEIWVSKAVFCATTAEAHSVLSRQHRRDLMGVCRRPCNVGLLPDGRPTFCLYRE